MNTPSWCLFKFDMGLRSFLFHLLVTKSSQWTTALLFESLFGTLCTRILYGGSPAAFWQINGFSRMGNCPGMKNLKESFSILGDEFWSSIFTHFVTNMLLALVYTIQYGSLLTRHMLRVTFSGQHLINNYSLILYDAISAKLHNTLGISPVWEEIRILAQKLYFWKLFLPPQCPSLVHKIYVTIQLYNASMPITRPQLLPYIHNYSFNCSSTTCLTITGYKY